jgi:cytochrome oxidase assembly protein ShyY1
MATPPLIVLELVLGFAVPVGWGVWQLISLRRDQREAEAQARRLAAPAAPADPTAPAAQDPG